MTYTVITDARSAIKIEARGIDSAKAKAEALGHRVDRVIWNGGECWYRETNVGR